MVDVPSVDEESEVSLDTLCQRLNRRAYQLSSVLVSLSINGKTTNGTHPFRFGLGNFNFFPGLIRRVPSVPSSWIEALSTSRSSQPGRIMGNKVATFTEQQIEDYQVKSSPFSWESDKSKRNKRK